MFWPVDEQGCKFAAVAWFTLFYYYSFKLDSGVQMSLIITNKIKYLFEYIAAVF